jgi:hypothetical protein
MSNYKIKKYNGTDAPIPELVEHSGTADNSTSLTFFSKGYDYGSALNTNMLRLMEHFCSVSKPPNPVMGQIWFDNVNKVLSVYNGTSWDIIKSAPMVQKELQWSGTFTQSNTGTNSTISGIISVTSTSCLFKSSLSINNNQALSDYIITGTIPTGLTVTVDVKSIFNTVYITLDGTLSSSEPTFNFKLAFTSYAFTNVVDISEVNSSSNTMVISMGNPAPTTTTTAAPTTTTTNAPTTTTTTSAPTTTTTSSLPPGVISINYQTIKFGITWGSAPSVVLDLDTVIVGYDSAGLCKMYRTASALVRFGTFDGITYNGDILVGGLEESYDINLDIVQYDTILLGILEYTDNTFNLMTSLTSRIVNTTVTPNVDIANFNLTTITKNAPNTPNTTCIIGEFTRTPSGWTYKSHQKLLNSTNGKSSFTQNDTLVSLGL